MSPFPPPEGVPRSSEPPRRRSRVALAAGVVGLVGVAGVGLLVAGGRSDETDTAFAATAPTTIEMSGSTGESSERAPATTSPVERSDADLEPRADLGDLGELDAEMLGSLADCLGVGSIGRTLLDDLSVAVLDDLFGGNSSGSVDSTMDGDLETWLEEWLSGTAETPAGVDGQLPADFRALLDDLLGASADDRDDELGEPGELDDLGDVSGELSADLGALIEELFPRVDDPAGDDGVANTELQSWLDELFEVPSSDRATADDGVPFDIENLLDDLSGVVTVLDDAAGHVTVADDDGISVIDLGDGGSVTISRDDDGVTVETDGGATVTHLDDLFDQVLTGGDPAGTGSLDSSNFDACIDDALAR